MYANDSNDFLPKFAHPVPTKIWCAPDGPLVDGGYIPSKIIYGGSGPGFYTGACPSSAYMWEYAMNWWISGQGYLRRGRITKPSDSVIVIETKMDYYFNPGSSTQNVDMWRHNLQMNFLYCDGHLDSRKRFAFAYSVPFWKSW
jgi:prepilin-type processing-associated H-X9-DG protein